MFESIFQDVVAGLKEYYPVLARPEVTEAVRSLVAPTFANSGNPQADYEGLRDTVEQLVTGEPLQVVSRLTQRVIEQAFGPLDALQASVGAANA